jgi:hypothetical protein
VLRDVDRVCDAAGAGGEGQAGGGSCIMSICIWLIAQQAGGCFECLCSHCGAEGRTFRIFDAGKSWRERSSRWAVASCVYVSGGSSNRLVF